MNCIGRVCWIAALLATTTALVGMRAQTRGADAPAAPARLGGVPFWPATLVLRGGRVVTVGDAKPEAQAIAVSGDRIVAVGSNQEIAVWVGPSTEVIELAGALAIPGLIDAHAHLTNLGQAATNLELAQALTWEEVVRIVADAASRAKPDAWLVGRGWHQEKQTARSSTPTSA